MGLFRLFGTMILLAYAPNLWASGSPADNRIVVDINNLRNNHGIVLCLLFASAEGFPGDRSQAVNKTAGKIADGKASCRFSGMPTGTYAVSYIHDENGNHHFDKGFFGIPVEGYGFSNNARGFLGPPKFDKAIFEFHGGVMAMPLKTSY